MLTSRSHANRISNIFTVSTNSGSDTDPVVVANKEMLSVEIERNDSGLGSETGRGRVTAKLVVRKRSDEETQETEEDVVCIDCDQVLEIVDGDR